MKTKWAFLVCALFSLGALVSTAIAADPDPITLHYRSGLEAYGKGNFRQAIEDFQWLVNRVPNDPGLLFQEARALARAGQTEQALASLERAVRLGGGVDAAEDPAFDDFSKSSRFAKIRKGIEELQKPVGSSEVAFRIGEEDLIPEGIAYDPVDDRFYLGSLYKRKIVSIDRTGDVKDFATRDSGLLSVVGIRIDARNRVLWANTMVDGPQMIDYDSRLLGRTEVFKFDLKTGKLIKRYLLETCPSKCMFNDLSVNAVGDVYLTDIYQGAIYRITRESDRLELFVKPGTLLFPNGIAFSKDEKLLFTGDWDGISAISVADASVTKVDYPPHVATGGIDGLYVYGDRLISVQNGWKPMRIQEFTLSRSMKAIVSSKTLAANNTHLQIPTTGAIAGDWFYYIANSQIDSFDKDDKIFPPDKLKDVIILKVKL